MATLELDALSKSYSGVVAVERLSLSVASGECIALLGPSGCGKTTTLRMVAGFIRPDSGHIRLAGRPLEHEPPHRRRIGMVFQAYALFPHMTAAGNVAFGLETRRLPKREVQDRTRAALALVGLDALGGRYPGQMSGGQQQRVALARALVIEPDLLLLDEPLSNLDASLRAGMRAEIDRLRRRLGITTLFVTHDQEEAMALADRVAVLRAGRLMECAAPPDLTERPGRVFTATFLGARTVLPGRVVAGAFVTTGGQSIIPALSPGMTHVVLRASRLQLHPAGMDPGGAPLSWPATVTEATWLGDHVAYEVTAGPHCIQVLRPTTEAPLPAGTAVLLLGQPSAIAAIHEEEP